MPTTQNLIDKVNLLVNNSLTDAQIVGFFNDCLRDPQVVKLLGIYKKDNSLLTVADQSQYTLPAGCEIERIRSIHVSNETTVDDDTTFTQYTFKGPDDSYSGYQYYNKFSGTIGLNPVPDTSGYEIDIYYDAVPTQLSTTDFTGTPDISDKYHDLLVFYACRWTALTLAIPDIDMANNYAMEYQDMLSKIADDYTLKRINTPQEQEIIDVYPYWI